MAHKSTSQKVTEARRAAMIADYVRKGKSASTVARLTGCTIADAIKAGAPA